MGPTFNELEERVLRFLKGEFLEKGSEPATMHDPVTYHRDVMQKFDLSLPQYTELIARLGALGIVNFNRLAVSSPNGILKTSPLVVEIVRQLDEQAAQMNAAAAARRDHKIFLSHKGANKSLVLQYFQVLKEIGFDPLVGRRCITGR